MARIAGINIPQNKIVSIALTYIHGIGPHSSNKICEKLEIPKTFRIYLALMIPILMHGTYNMICVIQDVDVNYIETNIFESVKTEFDAIAGIVELTRTWEETK